MANKEIAALGAAGTLGGAELVHVVDADGNSVKLTLAALKTFINTNPSVVPSAMPWRGARVRRTTNFPLTANVVYMLPWETADLNTNSIYSGAAVTRLTVPTGVTKVRLTHNIRFDISAAALRHMAVFKNGVPVHGMSAVRYGSIASNINDFNGTSAVLEVSPGDYFELQVISTNSVSILASERTWFEMTVVETS